MSESLFPFSRNVVIGLDAKFGTMQKYASNTWNFVGYSLSLVKSSSFVQRLLLYIESLKISERIIAMTQTTEFMKTLFCVSGGLIGFLMYNMIGFTFGVIIAAFILELRTQIFLITPFLNRYK